MTIRLGNKIISGGGSSGVPGWTGTLAEYNALTEIDDEMLYYITDDCLDSNSNHLGGLDIGDIGFTALGVNEELNCRRYLNGQVLAMDEFPEFTSKLKHAVSLNSSIAVDEDIWQTELAMSANGICYKFVIDDNNMTIRLPKYPEYFIAGLSDSTGVAGNGMTLGLTNGTDFGGLGEHAKLGTCNATYGAPIGSSQTYSSWPNTSVGVTQDPSKSGIEALVDSASEKVYGFYFIQVANGLEQTVDITREITLNNPFFLGMYQYFEVEPNNISWLKSEGQWNSAEVYPGMWEWLVENVNKDTKEFVVAGSPRYAFSSTNGYIYTLTKETPAVGMTCYGWSDGTYANIMFTTISQVNEDGTFVADCDGVDGIFTRDTSKDQSTVYPSDYDFIIDTETNTFRLPIEVQQKFYGSTASVVGNGMALGLTDGTTNAGMFMGAGNNAYMLGTGTAYGKDVGTTIAEGGYLRKTTAGITTDPSKSGIEAHLEENSNLKLYFYVGETIQDPTLINVGRITHALSLKTDMGQAAHAGMPSDKHTDMTLGASGTSYIAPADGYLSLSKNSNGANQNIRMYIHPHGNSSTHRFGNYGNAGSELIITAPVGKGAAISVFYDATGATNFFRFIYAEGSK